MRAYLHGVSTREVDDLVTTLGADTGDLEVRGSRNCADLNEEVGALRDHSLAGVGLSYVFLDATYCKARSTAGCLLSGGHRHRRHR